MLYPQYYEKSFEIIFIVCAAGSFSISASIIKPVIESCGVIKHLTYYYIIYAISFFLLGILLSITNGLIGFAYAMLISRFILWALEISDITYLWFKINNNKDKGN